MGFLGIGGGNLFDPSSWSGQQQAQQANPADYQYGNNPGDDAAQQLASLYGQQSSQQYGASVAGQNQLGSFYQGQLNGTGPSLAAQQAKASTDQSIAAQQATAASARGTLGQAGAQLQAGQLGAQARQAGAQAAVQGRIGEEYNAAQGLGNLTAQQQAGAQGWAGQQQSVWGGEEQAKEAQGNYNLGQASQSAAGGQAAMGDVLKVGGALLSATGSGGAAAADADLVEPGGGAGETLREERAVGGKPGWILKVDHQTGELSKIETKPLTPEEHAQARAAHGAGLLGSPGRMHTNFHDMGLGGLSLGHGDPDAPEANQNAPLFRGAGYSGPGPSGIKGFTDAPGNLGDALAGRTTLGPRGRFGDAPGDLGNALQFQPVSGPVPSAAGLTFHGTPVDTGAAPRGNLPPALGPAALSDIAAQTGTMPPVPAGTPSGVDPRGLVTGVPRATTGTGGVPLPGAASGGGVGGPARTGFVDTLDPADRARLESGISQENAGSAEVGQDLANEETQAAAGDKATAAQIGMNQGEAQNFERDRAHQAKQVQYQVDQASRDADKLGNDYGWHPDTATRVRYGIASFLGALGAGLAGTQNFAQEQIQSNINRDLDRQAKQIESAKGRVADMNTLLAQTYRQTGDMRQALTVAQLASLDKVKAEASAYAHASHSQTVKDNAQVLIGQTEQKQAEILGSHMKMVTMGGGAGAGADVRKQVIARAQKLVDEGKFDNVDEARRFAEGELGLTSAGGLQAAGKAGAGKVAAPSAQLQGALDAIRPGAGEDFYDRNAPNFLRSTDKLTEQARLVGAARAYLKAIGGREPPPGAEGDQAALTTAIGPRPTPEAVEAFRHAASHVAQVTANAGPSAAEPAEQP